MYFCAEAPTRSSFSGNAFVIDGNDWTLAGTAGPVSPAVGVATRTEVNAQEVRASLGASQLDSIQGKGFAWPPLVPSVAAVRGPDATAINRFVDRLLALPEVVTIGDPVIVAPLVLGSTSDPVVAHLSGSGAGVTVGAGGHVSGAGILVAEDSLTLVPLGSLDFDGLIVVRARALQFSTV